MCTAAIINFIPGTFGNILCTEYSGVVIWMYIILKMVHFPSLLVGSAVAGVSFLAVHQQLSYRERLTYRWSLQGSSI